MKSDFDNIIEIRKAYKLYKLGKDEKKWLKQISLLIQYSKIISDLLYKGKQILIHCNEGYDYTSILSSIVQIILESYYRTLRDFVILIEKEWISFGFPFSLRNSFKNDNTKKKESSPIFILFLFIVYQFIFQFPNLFEFNEEFLLFLTEEIYTNKFGTFLFDSEKSLEENKGKEINVSIWSEIFEDDEALLRKGNEIEQLFIEKIDSFAKNIKIINNIINYLELISLKGSIEDSNYKIVINKGEGKGKKVNEFNEKNIEILLEELKTFYNNQNETLNQIYFEFPLLRLISGRTFNKLNDAINNNKPNDLIFINKYLTNNNCKVKPNLGKLMTTEKNTLRKMYGIINNYISELYSLNNITISDIFKNAKKKDFLNLQDFTFEGIKSIKFLKDDLEKNTIYLYQLLTGKLPISQVILYCNKETTEEEVISFLYRSILFSDFPCLFSIIKPEHLKLEIKLIMIDTIKHLLDKLKTNQNSMISCLYFIYYDTYSDIISEIKLLPNYSEFKLNLDSNNKINEIMVYSSSQSGLGKST